MTPSFNCKMIIHLTSVAVEVVWFGRLLVQLNDNAQGPLRVNLVILTMRRSLPFYPDKRTFRAGRHLSKVPSPEVRIYRSLRRRILPRQSISALCAKGQRGSRHRLANRAPIVMRSHFWRPFLD
jgi:hypothetical protein